MTSKNCFGNTIVQEEIGWNIFYFPLFLLYAKHIDENMKGKQYRKVIHVHFIHNHRNYYFGSVAALFRRFSESDLDCAESYLSHLLTEDGMHHITSRVLIIRSRLIT